MRLSIFSVENCFYSQKLKEFALKPNVSTIEKTARIAAAIFLAIPTFLLDSCLKLAQAIQNQFVVHSRLIVPSAPPEEALFPQAPPPYSRLPSEPSADFSSQLDIPPPPYSRLPSAPSADFIRQLDIPPPPYNENSGLYPKS